ncbi:hypothetical protein M0802_003104 [Mischocyttarus mexicanus]|nr:hypothetical protein M0802_003104 [Mischocyttarus mexicanus]
MLKGKKEANQFRFPDVETRYEITLSPELFLLSSASDVGGNVPAGKSKRPFLATGLARPPSVENTTVCTLLRKRDKELGRKFEVWSMFSSNTGTTNTTTTTTTTTNRGLRQQGKSPFHFG